MLGEPEYVSTEVRGMRLSDEGGELVLFFLKNRRLAMARIDPDLILEDKNLCFQGFDDLPEI